MAHRSIPALARHVLTTSSNTILVLSLCALGLSFAACGGTPNGPGAGDGQGDGSAHFAWDGSSQNTARGDGGVGAASEFVIVSDTLATAYVGKAYEQQLAAEGGQAPYSWSLDSSDFSWIAVSGAAGKLSGLPSSIASGTVAMTLTDALGSRITKSLSLAVVACHEGDTADCFVQTADACLKGHQVCSGQQFGPCTNATVAADPGACSGTTLPQADTCLAGECRCGEGPACSAGFVCCDGACVDILKDPDHCGACNAACDSDRQNVVRACSGGSCTYACAPGWQRCPLGSSSRDCDTDTRTDASNCGGCGNRCPAPAQAAHTLAAAVCEAGLCKAQQCEAGWGDCNGQAADGCEHDLFADNANCGACGHACLSATPHAGPASCSQGQCKVSACIPDMDSSKKSVVADWHDCNGLDDDGCETDLLTDINNCAACGNQCPVGMSHQAGLPYCNRQTLRCSLRCDPGWGDCNGQAADGCETNLLTNSHKCGDCSNDCTSKGGFLGGELNTCTAGRCCIYNGDKLICD